jgi:hypothetical protein
VNGKEKVLDTLGKLRAHMESAQDLGSEQEAQAFAEMIQRLLIKHKLEMTDIQYNKHLQDEPVEEYRVGGGTMPQSPGSRVRVMVDFPDVEVAGQRIEWMETLGGVIARAHSCSILVPAKGSSLIWFVGRHSDIKVAEYMYVTMIRAVNKLSHKAYMKLRRECRAQDNGGGRYLGRTYHFKESWRAGFITRLHERFEEAKREMEGAGSKTALVRINKEALAVRDYMKEKFGDKSARSLGGARGHNSEGYLKGKEMADGINLKPNVMEGGNPEVPKELK